MDFSSPAFNFFFVLFDNPILLVLLFTYGYKGKILSSVKNISFGPIFLSSMNLQKSNLNFLSFCFK